MEDDSILERERYQMEQIRELDSEELQIEEVENSSEDGGDPNDPGFGGTYESAEFTFDTSLASLHTYLGEVEDIHHRLAFLDGGAVLNLPLVYLEGVVLFPDATLPLRVTRPNLIAAVENSLRRADASYTIGVVCVYKDTANWRMRFATTGTTAEIRQFRRLDDGSLNVVTRGQQRFRLRRSWIDAEGAPCGEIQIIKEDSPLRTPKDAFGRLEPLSTLNTVRSSQAKQHCADDDSDAMSEESFESKLSPTERRLHESAVGSAYGSDIVADDSSSSGSERFGCESEPELGSSHLKGFLGSPLSGNSNKSEIASRKIGRKSCGGFRWKKDSISRLQKTPRAYWPFWVYRMYDSYCLAQRAADMWKHIVGASGVDRLVKKPDLLSFYIASKIPVSESIRQELLEIDGISYRLRREIELLENFDRVRCKNCQTVIARRSDMLVMSSEGPLGAYVNPYGCVHEVMTLYKANNLALVGIPVKEYSWFPGYAWTVAYCGTCESQMGWHFTATNKKLKPCCFWGIRSTRVADDIR